MRRAERLVFLAATLVACVGAAAAPGEGPIAVTAAGILPIETESRLLVTDLAGIVVMKAAETRELRVVSVDAGNPSVERPVEVWLDNGRLTIRAPADDRNELRNVRLEVPSSIAVNVEASNLDVQAGQLDAGLDVRGDHLHVKLDGLPSNLVVDAKDSEIDLARVDADAAVRGQGLKVTIGSIAGSLSLALKSSSVKAELIGEDLEADLDATTITTKSVGGPAHARLRGGSATLGGFAGGGSIEAMGAPVVFTSAVGEYDIDTDTSFQFRDTKATLHVISRGGGVRGMNHSGLLEIKSDGGPIVLDGIYAPLRIQGDNLDVRLSDISGETLVYARSSGVVVEKVSSNLTIELDGGDVEVKGMMGKLGVTSKNGSVAVSQLNGSVKIEADGPLVSIGWLTLPTDGDSTIANGGGDVTLRFGASAFCRVQARTRFGRVESTVPTVAVTDDGSEAHGRVGGALGPLLGVSAGGDIRIETDRGQPPQ